MHSYLSYIIKMDNKYCSISSNKYKKLKNKLNYLLIN